MSNTLLRTTFSSVLLLITISVYPLLPTKAAQIEWQRTHRVTVFDAPLEARYPSVTKVGNETLLVLFTRRNADQIAAGNGELVIVRSTDGGDTWSDPTVVVSVQGAEPRAVDTMTTLNNGTIIAPFYELRDDQKESTVKLLISPDDGQTWQVQPIRADVPLSWWAPHGKILETSDGTLVIPLFGASSADELSATIHHSGLIRSRDGGKTWADFSFIARGRSHVRGASKLTKDPARRR